MEPFSIAAALTAMLSNPATWVALGSMGVGTFANMQRQSAIKDRQRTMNRREAARQQQMDDKKMASLRETLGQMERPAQEQEREGIASKLEQYLMPSDAAPGEYLSTNAAAPTEVKEREARALSESLGKAKDYAKNLANISSFGDHNFNTHVKLNRLGEGIGRINTDQQRSSQILQHELQGAMNAGSGWGTIADVANGVGTIASMYSMFNPVTAPGSLGSGLQLTEVNSLAPGFGAPGLKAATRPALGFKMPSLTM